MTPGVPPPPYWAPQQRPTCSAQGRGADKMLMYGPVRPAAEGHQRASESRCRRLTTGRPGGKAAQCPCISLRPQLPALAMQPSDTTCSQQRRQPPTCSTLLSPGARLHRTPRDPRRMPPPPPQYTHSRHFRRAELFAVGLPEPHVKCDQHYDDMVSFFKRKSITFCGNTSTKGRGGAAILFPPDVTLTTCWSPHARFLFASLSDPEGCNWNFMVGHFHHDASIRTEQWKMLSSMSRTLLPTNTVWLCDFNSVILPNRDMSHVGTSVKHASVLAARDEEILTLNSFNAIDSYAVTHAGRLEDVPLEGWTWGSPCTTQTNHDT